MNTPLQFEFPVNLTVGEFIGKLSRETGTQLVSKQASCKTFFDSFDWRLYSSGLTCEFDQTKASASLTLRSIKNGLVLADMALKKVPPFSAGFGQGKIRDILGPLLDMRALLPVSTLDYTLYHLNIVNKDEKTILRLRIEEYGQFCNHAYLQPVKGYDKAILHVAGLLTGKLGLTAVDKPVLVAALRIQGRKPNDYSSKLNINLAPDMRADIAVKCIYTHLLKAIKANEQGTIAATDSEFLHDFRVAVRRTRAGLSQIKGIMPANIIEHYAGFFSWLGQITGTTRDLDVYLLNFGRYKECLSPSIREDLNPLYDFLLAKQQHAQKELAKHLQSANYQGTLSEWEQFLKEPAFKQPLEKNARLTIHELADRRIWKIFSRVLQEGNAITPLSPSEALHDLRKSCKKLRYLMEFFQSLYPEQQIKHLIKDLKGLQEVLGDFQDYAVQEHNLQQFGEEMRALNVPANTFLAMGVLIQDLDAHKCRARTDFAEKFDGFKKAENQSTFKLLFASPKNHRHPLWG